MPSLLESVTALLGEGDTLDKLGELMGGDKEQASAATGLAVPAVLGGVADKAAEDSGLDAVMGMLSSNDSVLDDLGGFLDKGQNESGNGVLDAVFGDGRADVVSSLASKADVGSSMMGKLLPMLAPMVMGVIAKRKADDGLDDAGVGVLLADERASLEKDGLFESAGATLAGAGAVAGGALGGAVAMMGGAKDKLGDAAEGVGDAASGAKDGAKDAASGAKDAANDAASGAKNAAKDAAGDTADKAKGAAGAVNGAAGAKAAGIKGPGGGSDDDGTGTLGWLWWALGAVVLVLLLAWLLSTCNDETTEANDASATSADADADADDSDADADSGDAGDSDDSDSDEGADLQAMVDDALAGTGVTGVAKDGDVTLTGTVDSEQISFDAEDAMIALDGVESVDNQIEVADADSDDAAMEDEDDADAEDAMEEDGDADAEAGDTINELLDLDPVTFRVSSARITDEGILVLDDAAEFLEANPDVEIEIGGHTDDDGAEAENLDLSQRRAESVKAYLESQGIDGDRMETKGYGESQPKVTNTSASAKAENRRIEFTIL